ncbi:uncharacterized protein BDZ83DRAFT_644548 [Colletotrichum acutatum]|uniref:Uncharacterized protein n=1 Tax=Glomerella acutata TaxID=27357 RepID=A0AAD8U536_GLOAC|nr:uncharacterized protein BDZ83DRAFT_644548 [Colletotrichum acutatum]KAK1704421.1 hypothetical protein BDZ83DRAFT_644548 [Colletotrichum acutatum]
MCHLHDRLITIILCSAFEPASRTASLRTRCKSSVKWNYLISAVIAEIRPGLPPQSALSARHLTDKRNPHIARC